VLAQVYTGDSQEPRGRLIYALFHGTLPSYKSAGGNIQQKQYADITII
jgi:hypothetical protein